MSYEKVKSIGIKNGGVYITSACNNLRPLWFERWQVKADSVEEAVEKVLMNIVYGEFHLYNTKSLEKWNKVVNNDEVYQMVEKLYDIPYTNLEGRLAVKNELKALLMKRFKSEFNLWFFLYFHNRASCICVCMYRHICRDTCVEEHYDYTPT